MIHSGFMIEGYYDTFNMNADLLKRESGQIKMSRRAGAFDDVENSTVRYEFAFSPNTGFLASPDHLMKDTESRQSEEGLKMSNMDPRKVKMFMDSGNLC